MVMNHETGQAYVGSFHVQLTIATEETNPANQLSLITISKSNIAFVKASMDETLVIFLMSSELMRFILCCIIIFLTLLTMKHHT